MEVLFTLAGYWVHPADLLPQRSQLRGIRRLEVSDTAQDDDDDDDPLLWDDDDAIIADARQPYVPLSIDQDDTIIERQFAEHKRRLRGNKEKRK